jgi:hypothetical protein
VSLLAITFNKVILVVVATVVGVVLLYTGLPTMITAQIMMFLPECSAQEMVMPKKNDPGVALVQKLLAKVQMANLLPCCCFSPKQ